MTRRLIWSRPPVRGSTQCSLTVAERKHVSSASRPPSCRSVARTIVAAPLLATRALASSSRRAPVPRRSGRVGGSGRASCRAQAGFPITAPVEGFLYRAVRVDGEPRLSPRGLFCTRWPPGRGQKSPPRSNRGRPAYRHPRRCRVPHQADFLRGQAVGFVDQVVEAVFQLQCLGCQQSSRLDRAGVFVSEASKPCRSQRVLLASSLSEPRRRRRRNRVCELLEVSWSVR